MDLTTLTIIIAMYASLVSMVLGTVLVLLPHRLLKTLGILAIAITIFLLVVMAVVRQQGERKPLIISEQFWKPRKDEMTQWELRPEYCDEISPAEASNEELVEYIECLKEYEKVYEQSRRMLLHGLPDY